MDAQNVCVGESGSYELDVKTPKTKTSSATPPSHHASNKPSATVAGSNSARPAYVALPRRGSTPPTSPDNNLFHETPLPNPATSASSPVKPARPRLVYNREYLNLCDLQELHRHRHLLTVAENDCLNAVLWKIDRKPQRYARPDQQYDALAGLILTTETKYRDRFCSCGCGNRVCNWSRVCPSCAFHRRRGLYERLLPSFGRVPLYFLTISFTSDLDFEPALGNRLDLYWNACTEALKSMKKGGYFTGVLAQEALHVSSLLPKTRVLPHVHALVSGPDLSGAVLEELRRRVANYRHVVRFPEKDEDGTIYEVFEPLVEFVELEPCSRTYLIKTKTDLMRVLRYLTKPADFVTPYREAWDQFVNGDLDAAALLNQNAHDLVYGFTTNIARRFQHRRSGCLWPTSGATVIVPKEVRAKRDYWASIKNDLVDLDVAEQVALAKSDEDDRHWLGQSVEELEAARVDGAHVAETVYRNPPSAGRDSTQRRRRMPPAGRFPAGFWKMLETVVRCTLLRLGLLKR